MLVGRQAELVLLTERLAEDRAVAVVGEAGVGKSALLRAVAAASGRESFEGGGLATLSWMDQLPLQRAVGRPVAGADATAMAVDVAGLVGAGVLVLDDLQWSDATTIDVVTILAGRLGLLGGIRRGDPAAEPVLDRLRLAGVEVLELAPLADDEAKELLRRLRPDLPPSAVERLVRRTGGNPMLIHELSASGEPSASLRLALGARLRQLDAVGLEAFRLLALAGRPVRVDDLGAAGANAVVEAELGVLDGEMATVRHALLAEVAIELLDPAERAALHARLARMSGGLGEAARHHALAGEVELAAAKARRAADEATRPGERARHLAVAAACSEGPEADSLRLEAAKALADAGDWSAVEETIDRFRTADPEVQGWAALLGSRAAWFRGDLEAMRSTLAAGLAVTAGLGREIEVKLRIEEARLPIFVEYDWRAGILVATSALDLARSTGVDEARAEYLLGTAQGQLGEPGWDAHLEAALLAARRDGDAEIEFTAANNLISIHESAGSPAEGRRIGVEMIERARALGLGYWERCLRGMVVSLDFHAGAYARVLDEAQALLVEALDPRTRDVVIEVMVMALVDLGRRDEAALRLEAWSATALADPRGQAQLTLARAEIALWTGQPRRALELADASVQGNAGDGNADFARLVRAWACFDLGRDPGPEVAAYPLPMLSAVPEETAGLSCLFGGDHGGAVERFDAAADRWRLYHRRGELRCAWAAGEALRRAGDRRGACVRLEAVEARAEEHGMAPLLARIRQSLRASGQSRSAPRSTSASGLTGREREVLGLVAQGLSNREIAGRLGLSRHTIDAQVASSAAKLGATSRAQAALLADIA